MMTSQYAMDNTQDIAILFENDDVVVLNKPAGIAVHPDGRSSAPTVVDWFLSHVPGAHGVGEEQYAQNGTLLERSGVVHRLDTDTSGVLILAKNQNSFTHCKAQFHDRHAKKIYRAFVYGAMKERFGTIDRPIGRSARDFRLRSAQRGAKGSLREAVTDWECLQSGEYEGERFSELRLTPKTGRTHQLRVHLKAIDRPIVCDPLYADTRPNTSNNLGFDRLALHAHQLTLILPGDGEQTFEAPLPPAFITAANRIAPA